jgi:hypothetical protein
MNCTGDHPHAPKSVIKHCFELSGFWEASVKETAAFREKVSKDFEKV